MISEWYIIAIIKDDKWQDDCMWLWSFFINGVCLMNQALQAYRVWLSLTCKDSIRLMRKYSDPALSSSVNKHQLRNSVNRLNVRYHDIRNDFKWEGFFFCLTIELRGISLTVFENQRKSCRWKITGVGDKKIGWH